MPRAKRQQKESLSLSLPPKRAIELLQHKLAEADRIIALPYNSPEVDKWVRTTSEIIDHTFGRPNGEMHTNTSDFRYFTGIEETQALQNHHRNRKLILESAIEQLELLAPQANQPASTDSQLFICALAHFQTSGSGHYQLHPEIELLSGQLFRDTYYKQAALEAYIRLIEEVKARSRLTLDGDRLMNRAFGCDNQTPVIQFNSLQTDAERDEQRGLMYLYKGIVGLRNSKAQSNRIFNDPHRAFEYLALASLLMRLLEIPTTTTSF